MTEPVDFQSKLNVLCDAFAAQLPERLDHIEQAWHQLPREAWDDAGYRALHRDVHSLSGSGEIFGFSRLSAAARKLEHYLNPLLQARTPASEEQRARVEMLLGEFHQALKQPPT